MSEPLSEIGELLQKQRELREKISLFSDEQRSFLTAKGGKEFVADMHDAAFSALCARSTSFTKKDTARSFIAAKNAALNLMKYVAPVSQIKPANIHALSKHAQLYAHLYEFVQDCHEQLENIPDANPRKKQPDRLSRMVVQSIKEIFDQHNIRATTTIDGDFSRCTEIVFSAINQAKPHQLPRSVRDSILDVLQP